MKTFHLANRRTDYVNTDGFPVIAENVLAKSIEDAIESANACGDGPWTEATEEEYDAYVAFYNAEYDAEHPNEK